MGFKGVLTTICVLIFFATAPFSDAAEDVGDYEPLGLRMSTFKAFPKLEVGYRIDSNVYATENNEENNNITLIKPAVELRSDWNNHAFNLGGNGEFASYSDSTDENYNDWALHFNGRLDVLRDRYLFAGASYNALHEDRGSPDDASGKEPAQYKLISGNIGYNHSVAKISAVFEGAIDKYDYDDVPATGTPINNDDRDRSQYKASLRLGYELQPEYEAFIKGTYFSRGYNDDTDDNGENRDSTGYEAVAGIGINFTNVTTAEVFAGYRSQDYKDAALETINGASFGGSLYWTPTQLTSVTAYVSRTVKETTTPGTSGIFASAYGVIVDHELLRNLTLSGAAYMSNSDFQKENIDRSDDLLELKAGLKFSLNRNFYLSGKFHYKSQDSNVAGSDYTRNIGTIVLGGQM